MKIELTALTRPRISLGVSSCTIDMRITTLTMSAAPLTIKAAKEIANTVERPNTRVLKPNTATASNIRRPTLRSTGQRASTTDMSKAPTAGEARSNPSPQGPTCSTSLANIGNNAVAPPSNTANKSSEIAPSTGLLCQMKRKPANTVARVTSSAGGGTCTRRTARKNPVANANSAVQTA